ncbi:hypothetical protein IFM12276_52350 [Nocardia sputorum]|uniref:Uncharacterized protein n=1 Tax=Nocardia sputorum TaxID=2984338 RepID=A0ABN6UAA6_9NOCA|nr:hypothetical protein IFM12276_52350 [Nocardia sputorum]
MNMPKVDFETPVRSVMTGMCTTHMASRKPFNAKTVNTAARATRTGRSTVGLNTMSTVPRKHPPRPASPAEPAQGIVDLVVRPCGTLDTARHVRERVSFTMSNVTPGRDIPDFRDRPSP